MHVYPKTTSKHEESSKGKIKEKRKEKYKQLPHTVTANNLENIFIYVAYIAYNTIKMNGK